MAAYQEKIEYARLRLNCALAVQTILGFRTMEQPGEHGKGTLFSGYLEEVRIVERQIFIPRDRAVTSK